MKSFISVLLLATILTATVVTKIAAAGLKTTETYRWRNVEIGGTGFIAGIIFHPKAPGLIYVRTDIGGAYRWAPSTKEWDPLEDWIGDSDWGLLGIDSLALDPQDPQRVYLAAGMYTRPWASNASILRSSDQGKTWERTPLPFKLGGNENGRSIGERLAVDPNLGSRLFLGTRQNGLWKSEDFGRTWQQDANFPVQASPDGIGVGFVIFNPNSGKPGQASSTIYVGVATTAGTNLYGSTDGGATWNAIAGQPQGLIPHHAVLTPAGILYLTYSNEPGPSDATDGAVWKLDTAAGKWTDITPMKPGVNGQVKFGYAGLAVDAEHPDTVMVSTLDRWGPGDDIYRSTDGGLAWKGLAHDAVRDASSTPYLLWGRDKVEFGHWIGTVAIDPFDSNRALYGTGQTIWGTENLCAADAGLPTQWKTGVRGLEETAVQVLLSPPSGPPLISGLADVGGFRHDDLGASPPAGIWTNPIMNSIFGMDFAQNNPAIVVRFGASSEHHGAYSTDGAKTWTPFGSEPAASKSHGDPLPYALAVSADGRAFLWAIPGDFTYVSNDRGTTWNRCAGLGAGLQVIADRIDPQIFYALAADQHALFASKDGGKTFEAINPGLPSRAAQLHAAPTRAGDLWLTAGSDGLWHSQDGGATFARMKNVLSSETLGFGKAAPGGDYVAIYLVGTVNAIHGIFRSDDEGKRWQRINDDQHNYGYIGKAITGDPNRFGRVYLGTNGRGIIHGDPVKD